MKGRAVLGIKSEKFSDDKIGGFRSFLPDPLNEKIQKFSIKYGLIGSQLGHILALFGYLGEQRQ
jgi:hypothetical protein